MGHFSCIKIAPILIPEASDLISKVFAKSGKASNEVKINLSFNKFKVFS
jgi:hypothetical protein